MSGRPDDTRIRWDDVRIFLEIARAGSLTEAARRLRLGVATAGRRLRRLEAELGAPLVDRLPAGIALTPLGQEVAAAADPMDAGAHAMLRRVEAARSGPAAVRITATAAVSLFVAANLRTLIKACPDAEISLISTRARLSLAQREAEIALRMRRVPSEGDILVRRIGRVAVAPYAARAYLETHGTAPDRPHDAIGVRDDPSSSQTAQWLERFAGRRPRVRASELFLRHRAAADGLGVTLLPCFLGDEDARLARLVPPPAELGEDVFMMIHKDTSRRPAIRQVAEALRALFARQAARLDPEKGPAKGAGKSGGKAR